MTLSPQTTLPPLVARLRFVRATLAVVAESTSTDQNIADAIEGQALEVRDIIDELQEIADRKGARNDAR